MSQARKGAACSSLVGWRLGRMGNRGRVGSGLAWFGLVSGLLLQHVCCSGYVYIYMYVGWIINSWLWG